MEMSKALELALLLRKQIEERSGESVVFSEGSYHDEPIIFAGRELRRRETPERIRQMRALGRRVTARNMYAGLSQVFYEEAAFMADFEDDFPCQGRSEGFYPSYDGLDDRELRGYFTWRTHWRAGEAGEATKDFVYLHAYELICGIGSADAQAGYDELVRLGDAYPDAFLPRSWLSDYALYYGLDPDLVRRPGEAGFAAAVGVLKQAEAALLASPAPGTWHEPAGGPSADELLGALCAASRYRLERSALMRQHREELAEVCAQTFARMVEHCHRRRKTDFVEGMFGPPSAMRCYLFPSALFWRPDPHPDARVRMSASEAYVCRDGRWSHEVGFRRWDTSKDLGNLLHACDRVLRDRIGGVSPLKERQIPKYQLTFVNESVDALFERVAQQEAAHVSIDRSRLSAIRAAAGRTRDALLVDEERDEYAVPAEPPLPFAVASAAAPATAVPAAPAPKAPAPAPATDAPDAADGAMADDAAPAGEGPEGDLGITARQIEILREILAGTFDGAAWEARGIMPELEVDAINEALYGSIGDAAIEYEDAAPKVSEFYRDDVRRLVG